jgi:hypothetical protein
MTAKLPADLFETDAGCATCLISAAEKLGRTFRTARSRQTGAARQHRQSNGGLGKNLDQYTLKSGTQVAGLIRKKRPTGSSCRPTPTGNGS